MKPLIYNDILAAAACVSGMGDPMPAVRRLLREADLAQSYVQRHHAAHPVFGDGSLMAAALRHGRHGDVSFATHRGRAAWVAVLTALQGHDVSLRRSRCSG